MFGSEYVIAWLFLLLLFFAVQVAILRWAFRVNHIVNRLDTIINALTVGLNIEEDKLRK